MKPTFTEVEICLDQTSKIKWKLQLPNQAHCLIETFHLHRVLFEVSRLCDLALPSVMYMYLK